MESIGAVAFSSILPFFILSLSFLQPPPHTPSPLNTFFIFSDALIYCGRGFGVLSIVIDFHLRKKNI